MALHLFCVCRSAAHPLPWVLHQQFEDEVSDVPGEEIGHGRLTAQDSLADLLLRVLLALNSEGTGPCEQLVGEHPNTPPVNSDVMAKVAASDHFWRHVLNSAAEAVGAMLSLSGKKLTAEPKVSEGNVAIPVKEDVL